MKKLMFASLALLGSVALANAQEATLPQESNKATEAVAPAPAPAAVDQEDKTKIKSEELPEAVKKSLEA